MIIQMKQGPTAYCYVFVLFVLTFSSLSDGQTNQSKQMTVKKGETTSIAQTNDDETIITQIMDNYAKASKSNDATYFIETMYAPFVEKMGGKSEALKMAKAAMAEIEHQGITYYSFKTKKPYTFVNVSSRRYVIIQQEMILEKKGDKRKLKSSSYLLGIKQGNSSWQFAAGDKLDSGIYDEFFPDFPKDIKLPKIERVFE